MLCSGPSRMASERTTPERAALVAQKLAESFRRRHTEATSGAPAPAVDWDFWAKKLVDQLSDPELAIDWDLSRLAEGHVVLKLKKGQLVDRAMMSMEDLEARHTPRVLTTLRAAHERLLRLGPPRPARWERE